MSNAKALRYKNEKGKIFSIANVVGVSSKPQDAWYSNIILFQCYHYYGW